MHIAQGTDRKKVCERSDEQYNSDLTDDVTLRHKLSLEPESQVFIYFHYQNIKLQFFLFLFKAGYLLSKSKGVFILYNVHVHVHSRL